MATRVEVQQTIVTIQPNSWNIIPAIPLSIVRGTNTATSTRVVAITDTQTSLVAYIAASCGSSPLSTCRVIFSSTTIASSTTIPIAMVSEQREMMLIDESATFRYINAPIRAIGIVIPIIIVARHLPRKNNTTNTTKSSAYSTDSSSELMEFCMFSDESYIFSIFTSVGNCFCMSANSLRTSRQTCTVLAPVCFAMISRTASRALVFSSSERSLSVSLIAAMSRMNTCCPCGVIVTIRLAISEDSRYSLRTCIWYCSLGIFTVPDERLRLLAVTT